MKKDTLTMHDASTRKPAPGAGTLATATLGLAAMLIALPAAGQGAVSSLPSSGSREVAPVVVVSDAAVPVNRHEQAPLPMANANAGVAQAAVAESVEPQAPHYAAVGDATRNLLDLQRSGQIASPVPRPVPGEIAQRSRERYLKSFEREIPEWFQSSVSEKSASQ